MAKPKRGSSSGPHKKHGPKKKMFHEYPKALRIEMAKLGMLKKEFDKEARAQSESAKAAKVLRK